MKDFEQKQIKEYLNKKFETNNFSVRKRKTIEDSFEIYLGDEFLGLIYKEDEDGEIAYQFHMTILNEDLFDS